MIVGTIKAEDFPLFRDEDLLEYHGLKEDSIIKVVLGYDGIPAKNDEYDIDRLYVADFYYPEQKELPYEDEENIFYTNSYETFPILIEAFIDIKKEN